ncbi:MAG: DUF92 domain-containing protein, partial [Clostridia bacterium]|nr:DUF92 domain-containing protein [Clostridia bacterium]
VGGIIAAIVIDVAASLAFGNFGFVILALFFVGSMATDKFKKRSAKSRQSFKSDNKGHRNIIQVFANGAVAAVSAAIFILTKQTIFAVSFVASMAESLADTAASGIGSSSQSVYDIVRLKRCAPGVSGGVSISGTLAALVASLILPLVAIPFGILNITGSLVASAAAFLGMIVDSVLGSLLQAKYQCLRCGTVLEQTNHCGEKCLKISGVAVVDNNLVNFISNFTSALFGAGAFMLFM